MGQGEQKRRQGFYWERHPEAERFLLEVIEDYGKRSPALSDFERKLITRTSTRLLDWVDHLLMADTAQNVNRLADFGFVRETDFPAYTHPGARLPAVVLTEGGTDRKTGIALRVESISDFLQANRWTADIEGTPYSPYRRSRISTENGIAFLAVERRGNRGYEPTYPSTEYLQNYHEAVETWRRLPRFLVEEGKAFDEILETAGRIATRIGRDLTAHIVCLCERNYWLSRNHAGRVQKARHDALGLGWANHDHHTFRSCRRNFSRLVSLFIRLGFEKRERFYAGEEAGWGAQVMEQPEAGLALFLDVDLAPEEVEIDFTEDTLQERSSLGTVGLWCALHGDSILQAGMHHLAANFLFERLTSDLSEVGVEFMAPFSNFSYLKQSFSKGEIWPVEPARVKVLLADRKISDRQAESFLERGAIGSHLENIERREGYKGFNRKNVSAIIRQTDPRKQDEG
jgi:hypothetical protein